MAQPLADQILRKIGEARELYQPALQVPGLLGAIVGEATGEPQGREVPSQRPGGIDVAFLMQSEEFKIFRRRQGKNQTKINNEDYGADPFEPIEHAFSDYQEVLVEELMQTIRGVSPALLSAWWCCCW
jgi:hypothetical protein